MTTGSSLTGAGSLQGDLDVGAAFLERLSLRTLPPGQLTTTLLHLIEHGTGAAAYYADVTEAVVALAVEAPCGPPPARLISCPGWIRAWPPGHRKAAPWPKRGPGRGAGEGPPGRKGAGAPGGGSGPRVGPGGGARKADRRMAALGQSSRL